MKARILFLIGTRPEVIKLAPVIRLFKKDEGFESRICVTAQHRDLLDPMLAFFGLVPDFDLDLMEPGQSPMQVLSRGLSAVEGILMKFKPDLLFVQGDTTTVLTGGLAGAYLKIPVAHVEAGLRSHDLSAPFPEEYNRKLVAQLATFHFTPTESATANLYAEGISSQVHFTGNTVVDALSETLRILDEMQPAPIPGLRERVSGERIVLVTCHRRETFGKPLEDVCRALKALASEPNVHIVFPVHLNPEVRKVVFRELDGISNVDLIGPLGYPDFIRLMQRSYLILTDSGGIQEEAPTLNKPVLVLRNQTERPEGVEAGTAMVVGTDSDSILHSAKKVLGNKALHQKMAEAPNPYGDGKAAERIHRIVREFFLRERTRVS
jgi:UDP-N-acetylglucosamine 2-epimerase (non-hydrolysing)